MRSLCLPVLAFFTTILPLAAQSPVLAPALVPPGDVGSFEAGGVQHEPYIAPGGDGALVVWVDHRAEFHSPLQSEPAPDVFAIRLDQAGAPMDSVALRMPFTVGDKKEVRAAWNGSTWLVTWQNQDPFGCSSCHFVLGARVAADGTLLDNEPFVIKDTQSTSGTSTLSSNGSDWVMTVQSIPSAPAGIVGFRIAADGTVVNPGGTLIQNIATAQGRGDVEYADGVYLLAFSPGSPTSGLRFDDTFTPIGGVFTLAGGTSARPRVATDGTDFMVTWQNSVVSGQNIRARRIDGATGTMSNIIQITPATNGDFNWDPDVAWTGSLWTIVCTDTNDDVFRFARIQPDLTLLDPGGVALPIVPATADSRAASAGLVGGTAIVFETTDLSQNWPGAVESARVDDAGTATSAVPLSLSSVRQGFPSIAAGDGQYLAVFTAEQDDTIVIEAQRFDAFGVALDAEPIELASGNRYGEPKVAFGGDSYLVVWEDRVVLGFETDDVVLGMRVALDGSVLDATPISIMEGGKPDVAANDGTYLVVSSDSPTSDIRLPLAQRVGSDGTLIGSTEQIGANFARYPRVAALGAGWIATWQRQPSHDNPNTSVRVALIAADGSASSEVFVGGNARPNVASNGESALVIWLDSSGVTGRIVSTDGSTSSTIAIAPSPALPGLADIGWNGEDYLVTWADYRDIVGFWDTRRDIFAARVTAGGTVLDTGGGFPVATSQEDEFGATTAGMFGSHLLGYTALLPDQPYATVRLVLRLESPWSSLDGGVGGASLAASGDVVSGGTIELALSDAPAFATGTIVVGASVLGAPFKGGTMVPSLDLLLPAATDHAGALTLAGTLPAGIPPGFTIVFQTWHADARAPAGFTGSNALESEAP